MNTKPTKFRRFRLRFSIRSLLLLTVVSGLCLVVFQIATGPDLNRRLYRAMKDDRTFAIHFYLWLGADPNDGIKKNFGYNWSPLQDAAWRGHLSLARHLIANGANANYMEKDGFTAIVYAADEDHWDIVEMLYRAGADHRATGADGKRVVDYAIDAGREDIVQLLTSDVYPPGFWRIDTVAVQFDGKDIVELDDNNLPYNRIYQIARNSQVGTDKWPFLSGTRRYTALIEKDANGNEQTVRGVMSVKISEDQNWVDVLYIDGSSKREPL
ncbi:ankyrin repeat domain-containing protein [Stieleria varia]|uniref:Ankyrin repeats (3 copies) n=1 Tax=Stieleria varia TaxID=2528005 RepID=A0A5C6AWN4_9BACT|nr:ankyrin repeat domain-containing protein [Stieleria varia]TWU02534.1 Ankyrin repeats (3 copies) [Stieleria varia]